MCWVENKKIEIRIFESVRCYNSSTPPLGGIGLKKGGIGLKKGKKNFQIGALL